MCRNVEHGGRRCPHESSPERNAARRAKYAQQKHEAGLSYNPHKTSVITSTRTITSNNIPLLSTQPAEAPEGYVKLYHGTLDKHIESVATEGLKASESAMQPAKWFMLTTSYDQAQSYAGEGGMVVEFTMPATALNYRNEDGCVWPGTEHDVYGQKATAYAPKGLVPNSYVTAVYEPKK